MINPNNLLIAIKKTDVPSIVAQLFEIKPRFQHPHSESTSFKRIRLDDGAFAAAIPAFDEAMQAQGIPVIRRMRVLNDLMHLAAFTNANETLKSLIELPLIKHHLTHPHHDLHELLYCVNPDILTFLLEGLHFNPNYENSRYETPLYALAKIKTTDIDSERFTKLFSIFIEHGANLDFIGPDGKSLVSCIGEDPERTYDLFIKPGHIALKETRLSQAAEWRALTYALDRKLLTEGMYEDFLKKYDNIELEEKTLYPLIIRLKDYPTRKMYDGNDDLLCEAILDTCSFLASKNTSEAFKERLKQSLSTRSSAIYSILHEQSMTVYEFTPGHHLSLLDAMDHILLTVGLKPPHRLFSPNEMMTMIKTHHAITKNNRAITRTTINELVTEKQLNEQINKKILTRLICQFIDQTKLYNLLTAFNNGTLDNQTLKLFYLAHCQTMDDALDALVMLRDTSELNLFSYTKNNYDLDEISNMVAYMNPSDRQKLKKILLESLSDERILDALVAAHRHAHRTPFEVILRVSGSGCTNRETSSYEKYIAKITARKNQLSKIGLFKDSSNDIELETTHLSPAAQELKNHK